MNEKSPSDRHLRLAPLVLRLGLAAVLLHSGIGQVAPIFGEETGQSLSADGQGVALTANWNTVMGAAQLGIGTFLLAGFWTRWIALGVLGALGYGGFVALSTAGAETVSQVAQLFETNRGAILLLAAACASLLVSGAGCLGFDCRNRRRRLHSETIAA
ncbi:MAG: DoxX family protein [Phycisphaerae bacterium]